MESVERGGIFYLLRNIYLGPGISVFHILALTPCRLMNRDIKNEAGQGECLKNVSKDGNTRPDIRIS